jgi:hypothetical protein
MTKTFIPALLLLSAPLALAEKKQLQPGEWEITVQMELEGSSMQMPPMTMKKCITPEDAKQPGEIFRSKNPHASPHGDDDCQMKDQKQEGNKYSWGVDCGPKGKGSGSVTFEPGKYDGTARMEMVDNKGVLRRMKMTMAGHRVGECK